MLKVLLRKGTELILVLFFVSLIVFFTFRLLPGDPAQMRLGMDPAPEAVEALRNEMGLDKPLVVQYAKWIGDVVRGDLGKSMFDGKPVTELLSEKIPKTFELAIYGALLAIVIAVPFGVLAVLNKNSWIDKTARVFSLFGFSIPAYWLAVLLMLLFAYKIHWLPAGGYVPFNDSPSGHFKALILPVITVGIINSAQIFRYLRSGMLEVISQDFIRTARAKGVSEWSVIAKHVARNALPSLITIVALNFSLLLSGMVITEQIFAWPGVGWLMIQSILSRDYDVVQGAVLMSAVIIVLINLLADLINALLDPRIKHN
ncbi:ABC transporter permease subunit [Paenibacillus sp. LMG 31456]|uniref:ABC transporter permease subunit n=1 Tax=Paenibacillus foliorum TaxID=2654974 RepID=A0A972H376_9BACL|nr:ABC transporter permease [Paenibacillus foliorum]NOU97845.1 ABC transporter permease subunit [Paenibacillus foliorum]